MVSRFLHVLASGGGVCDLFNKWPSFVDIMS